MTGPRRLALAALVCVLALGLGWRGASGRLLPGLILPTTTISPVTGDLWMGTHYYPGRWIEADPMRAPRGHESDVRVVLVPAAVALGLLAHGRTHERERVARVAVLALAGIGLVAAGRGMPAAALAMALAVWLAAPVVGSVPVVGRWVSASPGQRAV